MSLGLTPNNSLEGIMKKMTRSALMVLLCSIAVIAACVPQDEGGSPPSLAPIAVIEPIQQHGGAPYVVDFDATGSIDPDGEIVKYEWDFGDGTTALGPVVQHTYLEGQWRAQLVVTDNSGKIGTAFVDITVTNFAPVAAFTMTPTSGSSPLQVTLNGSGSYDPDGHIVSHHWQLAHGGSWTGETVNITLGGGVHQITLTVTDNAGKTDSTTQQITVAGAPTGAPSDIKKVDSGCCHTWGEFTWKQVPGATRYEIHLGGRFGGGCVTSHSGTVQGQVGFGRITAVGLCLGSSYDVRIRAGSADGWGPWSATRRLNL